MESKVVLIIEPATTGYGLMHIAKTLGYKVFVFSADKDERVIPEDYKQYIDQLVVVDTNQLSQVIVALSQIGRKPDAVIPGFELYVPVAAEVAKYLGLPHVALTAAYALRDKGKQRCMLSQAKIRVPNFYRISSLSDIDKFSNHLYFPLVIKPIDQSGSVHVSKVNNLSQLVQAYKAMCADTWTEMDKGVGHVAIVEEFIDGQEYSVEGYVSKGAINVVSITEKTTTKPPYFVEMRHIVPANISATLKKQIENYINSVLLALKVNLGVFHAEIKVDHQGPVLIEIAGRLAGDRICDLIKISSGVDLREIMLETHLDQSVVLKAGNHNSYAGIQYFHIEKSGYQKVVGYETLREMPGFYDAQLLYRPNQTVPVLNSFLGRVGYFMATATTYDALLSRIENMKQRVKFL